MNDRRRSARLAESLTFKFAYQGYDITADTLNVSETGLLCRVSSPVPVMTIIALVLVLPPEAPGEAARELRAKGVVVRSDDEKPGFWQLAIYYTEIAESNRKLLKTYISGRLPRHPRA